MSSTLIIRKTPKPTKEEASFKYPVKGWIARKYYDHDGSCGGGLITVGAEDLAWWEGVLLAGNMDEKDRGKLEKIVEILRDGGTIDMWFE